MSDLTLTMPRLGETMEEGVVVGWMVAPGDAFKRGQPILELETDKTVVEFPALGDGVLVETLAGPGERIKVGSPIARATVAQQSDWAEAVAEDAAPTLGDAPASADVPSILRMPKLGETMDEGVIATWLLAEGDRYGRGEAILEVETDKTVAEVPALYEGQLLRILAQPGERLPVGAPIAEVAGRVEDEVATAAPQEETVQGASAHNAPRIAPPAESSAGLRATPPARRMARRSGVDLEAVSGTGRRGRIELRDVEAVISSGASAGDLRWLTTDAGRIAYDVAGSGGRTYLLVHGFAGDRLAWAQVSAGLARAGQTAVALDLPGHGVSEIDAASPDELASAIAALARTLPHGLTLVAHSLGAVAAVMAAVRLGAHVGRLVLLTPAGAGPRIGADFVHGMAQACSAAELSHLLRLLGQRGGSLSDAALTQMAAQMARGRLKQLATAVATPDGRQRVDILRPLAQLKLPVSAIFGTNDTIVDPRDALNLPLNVAAHFVPTGHMPQWDAARDLIDFILAGDDHG